MNKKNTPLTCQIKDISNQQTFNRNTKPPFIKRIITLETEDGQILYCELRKMNLLDDVIVGSVVDVQISFAGSEKNNKKYNNIFINDMKLRK